MLHSAAARHLRPLETAAARRRPPRVRGESPRAAVAAYSFEISIACDARAARHRHRRGRRARSANAMRLASTSRCREVGRVVAQRLQVEALEDVEHLERDEALRVETAARTRRSRGSWSRSAATQSERCAAKSRSSIRPSRRRMSAAIAAAIGPLVERVASARGDLLERGCQLRVAEDLAGRRCAARTAGTSRAAIGSVAQTAPRRPSTRRR